MSDDLKFWTLREWLTINETTSLILGCNPSNTNYQPDGWEGLNKALYEAVAKSDGFIFDSRAVDFQGEELSGDYTLLRVKEIKEWLSMKGLKPSFFFSNDDFKLTTEKIEPIKPNLDIWKIKHQYTPIEAACLLNEVDPTMYVRDKRAFDKIPIEGTLVNLRASIDSGFFSRESVYFVNDNHEIRHHKDQRKTPVYEGFQEVIEKGALELWCYTFDIDDTIFSKNNTKTIDKETREKPEYQTKLMPIMYDTINRYYGENYDPNNRDSVPTKPVVIDWLRDTYSLSEIEAKAIDMMTRPDHVRKPQGKN